MLIKHTMAQTGMFTITFVSFQIPFLNKDILIIIIIIIITNILSGKPRKYFR